MRRTILSSVLVIGAALAVVFGGGAFSAFTDTESIEGSATAAILDFELQSVTNTGNTTGTTETGTPAGGSSLETLVVNFATTECANNYFAPGDSCTIEVNLTRNAATIAQQLAAILSVSSFTITGETDLDTDPNEFGIDCDTGQTNAHAGADWLISYQFVDNDDAGASTDDNAYFPAATPDPGQQIWITVALHADAAGNALGGCQGDQLGSINISILATQDTANSHNILDDVTP
jgi:predicted ribosomally synthesized peptide with SipW-like signal peptide